MSAVVLLERGEVIAGRYEIDSPIGQGGMAVVYRARHQQSGKACALKLLQGRWLEEEGLLDRFLKEARILDRIGAHPNIVDVFDAGLDEERGVPYIGMELLEGQTLADYLDDRSPVSHLVARAILTQVTNALEEAHRAGIVHRDLKPANIFVSVDDTGTPKIKVLDFGIAKEADHTHTATEVGTPGMEAPEQLGADIREYAASQGVTITRGISPQTDVWALGLLAYRVFTGRTARQYWGEPSAGAVILAVAVGTRPRPSERAEDLAQALPPGFDAWFLRCLDSDAAKRWPSASAALDALFDTAAAEPDAAGESAVSADAAEAAPAAPVAPPREQLRTVADAPQAMAVERGAQKPAADTEVIPIEADDSTPEDGEPDGSEADDSTGDGSAPAVAEAPKREAERTPATPAERRASPHEAVPARSMRLPPPRQLLPWLALALIIAAATAIGVMRPRSHESGRGLTSATAPTPSLTAPPTATPSAPAPAPAASSTATPGASTEVSVPTTGWSTRPKPPGPRPRPAPSQDQFDVLFGDR